MDAAEWGKIITDFLAFAYRPSLIGLPTAMFAFHFSFTKILLISLTSSIFSSVVSVYLSKELIMLYEYVMRKIYPNRQKRRMTKINRLLVKIKQYFGVVGVSVISPLVLSIPFGTFIAISFFGYKNRVKTIVLMSLSAVVWTIILYFIYNKFYVHFLTYFK
jgi:type IV secretory pathway VirB3-like protein